MEHSPSTVPLGPVNPVFEEYLSGESLAKMHCMRDVHARGYLHVQSWNVHGVDLDESLLEEAQVSSAGVYQYYYWAEADTLTYAWHSHDGTFNGTTYGLSMEAIKARIAKMRLLTRKQPQKPREIRVRFWMDTKDGPTFRSRLLEVPTWHEIRSNYSSEVQTQLDDLMNLETWDERKGKLLLWRGAPGGGKTYALRSLIRSWSKWSVISYIMDPELFLGGGGGYLLEVCTESQDDESKWRLIVMEDSGELLGADARQKSGQGMSRLLNVVDGFIGQGLKVVVLVTTNEEIRKLHPAISRKGRCAMNLEFGPLPVNEAQAWLRERGSTEPVTRPATLSDLYAQLEERPENEHQAKKQQIGFQFPRSLEEEPVGVQ